MAIYHLSHTYVGKSTQKQAHTASAHSNYITRPTRATEVMGERMPTTWREAAAWLQAQEDADRKNARVIDKVEVALPKELTHEQNAELVRGFCEELTKGRAPWLAAMHDGEKDASNPHAHIILRDRDFETGRRVMMTTERGTIDVIRETWERHANLALERGGHDARIDRRTLEEQGIDREPQIHVGPNVGAMIEKGITPESRALEVQRIDFATGDRRPIIIDYPAIDSGRTRAEFNEEIKERNAELERGRSLVADHYVEEATSRGGMVAQQREAMEHTQAAHWCTLGLEDAKPRSGVVFAGPSTLRDGQARFPLDGPHETRRTRGAGRPRRTTG